MDAIRDDDIPSICCVDGEEDDIGLCFTGRKAWSNVKKHVAGKIAYIVMFTSLNRHRDSQTIGSFLSSS